MTVVVEVESGRVAGVARPGGTAYLGIPYAAPPIGDLRWRPPRPCPPWAGVRAATASGPACAQRPDPLNGHRASLAEDPLHLDVHVAAGGGTGLPVLVWLHGGENAYGRGGDFDPAPLLAAGGVIVVTVTYRTGVLGYLAHPALADGDTDACGGNLALLDQQAALRWVRRNIAAFGGAPETVTVAGQSSGGSSIHAHLVSPPAAGLFARAIVQSGSFGSKYATADEAHAQAERVTAAAGCRSVRELRRVPVGRLLDASAGQTWRPTVGGTVLPRQVREAVTDGEWHRTPVIEGTNRDEARLLVACLTSRRTGRLSARDYRTLVRMVFRVHLDPILERYPVGEFPSPELAYAALTTDAWFAYPASTARSLFGAGTPTFGYEFDDRDAPPVHPLTAPFPLGAHHTAELSYLFRVAGSTARLAPAQQRLSAAMARYWVAFAAHGEPAADGLPCWPPSGERGLVQRLSPDGIAPIATFDADHHGDFWGDRWDLGMALAAAESVDNDGNR